MRIILSSHKPAGFILRFDGEAIPNAVLMVRYDYNLHFDAKGELVMDRLPAGVYELWPLPPDIAFDAVAAPSTPPAARAGLSTGEVAVRSRVA